MGIGSGSDGSSGSIGADGNTRHASFHTAAASSALSHAATEPKAVILGGNVLEAQMVKRVMPVYPPLARQMRLSGTVRLEGVISRTGQVINLQVVSGHPMLSLCGAGRRASMGLSPTC